MKVLIAEDESTISSILEANLKHAGFETFVSSNGLSVLPDVESESPDFILLDIMLPGTNGYEICKKLRQNYNIPIIMITARTSEQDRLTGFDMGADDYICKPFSPREVIARIKSIIRRDENKSHNIDLVLRDKGEIDTFPEFYICRNSVTVSFMGQSISLTQSEFNLLVALVSHPNRVFERSHLLDILAQDNHHCTDRVVDSHIKNLRQKLRKVAPDKSIIQAVYGVGYKISYPMI